MALPSTGAGRTSTTPAPATPVRIPAQVRRTLPCREGDPDLWFAEHPAQINQAKELCRTCPIMAECLAGALERRELWGVWGGELVINGVIVAHKRGRGRPRKNAAA